MGHIWAYIGLIVFRIEVHARAWKGTLVRPFMGVHDAHMDPCRARSARYNKHESPLSNVIDGGGGGGEGN
jgi:hypothetical protein